MNLLLFHTFHLMYKLTKPQKGWMLCQAKFRLWFKRVPMKFLFEKYLILKTQVTITSRMIISFQLCFLNMTKLNLRKCWIPTHPHSFLVTKFSQLNKLMFPLTLLFNRHRRNKSSVPTHHLKKMVTQICLCNTLEDTKQLTWPILLKSLINIFFQYKNYNF